MKRDQAKGISWKISAFFLSLESLYYGTVTENKGSGFFAFETCSGILALIGVFLFFNSNRISLSNV